MGVFDDDSLGSALSIYGYMYIQRTGGQACLHSTNYFVYDSVIMMLTLTMFK